MKERTKKRARAVETRTIWERAEPAVRPAPVPLSREAIVEAAIAIADAQGLAAVSLRNVGSALGAGPMRLYGYMSTKEELLELMVDAMYGEIVTGKPRSGDWRRALRSIALATRRAAQRHPWFADLQGGRPHQGPNALAYLERILSALSVAPGFEDIDAVMLAARTVNAYMIGAIRRELGELRAERESGMNRAAWEAATSPYRARMIATGKFPTISRVGREATHRSKDFDVVFEQGLNWVLDGIAGRPGPGVSGGAVSDPRP
jgi:AcrR family transcriptional regulator